MKQPMVVSNVRLPEYEWVQIKILAAELGMSINEYIKYLVNTDVKERMFGLRASPTRQNKRSLADLSKLAKIKNKPMEASEEDKIIYGL